MAGRKLVRAAVALACVAALVAPGSSVAAPGDVTVVAGGGDGSGAPATAVGLRESHAIAFGPDGDLYIGESEVRRIRRVDADLGTIHTVFNPVNVYPERIAFAPDGALHYATYSLLRPYSHDHVYRIDPATGDDTVIAGTGAAGFSGDGGPAIEATLNRPAGIAFDPAGNLYIADQFNHRVRKVDAAGVISTVVGNGTAAFAGDGGPATDASLNEPMGVAFRDGKLYIADSGNGRIRVVDGGIITTVAGGGSVNVRDVFDRPVYQGDGLPATMARLDRPSDVAVDPAGGIVIADTGEVRRVDPLTGHMLLVALGGASQLAIGADGTVHTITTSPSPWWNSTVDRIGTAGTRTRVAGNGTCCYSGNGGPGPAADLTRLSAIAVGPSGDPIWSEGGSPHVGYTDVPHVVRTLANDLVRPIAGNGSFGGGISPYFVAQEGSDARDAALSWPQGLAVDHAGNVIVADTGSGRVLLVTAAGNRLLSIVGGIGEEPNAPRPARASRLIAPVGVALDGNGNLFITDPGTYGTADSVYRVDPNGTISRIAGGSAECGAPGDGGPATSASLCQPWDVAADGVGNVYIADLFGHRVRRIDPSGTISTVVGDGTCGHDGDGGPATGARVCNPTGLALGPDGDLFVAHAGSLRRIDAETGTISSLAIAGFDVAIDADGDLFVADVRTVKRVEAGAA